MFGTSVSYVLRALRLNTLFWHISELCFEGTELELPMLVCKLRYEGTELEHPILAHH